MNDYILNYIRCPYCAGNMRGPGHNCTPEGEINERTNDPHEIEKWITDISNHLTRKFT